MTAHQCSADETDRRVGLGVEDLFCREMSKSHCSHTEEFLNGIVMIVSLYYVVLGNHTTGKEQSFRYVRLKTLAFYRYTCSLMASVSFLWFSIVALVL